MSEVTKLYENAHVYPRVYGDITKETFENKVFNMGDMCNEAFTAEKQLELIKWLCQKTYRNYLLIKYNFTNYYWQIECNMTDSDKLDNFTETIASIINNLWQDLSEEERKQIKEILE